MIDETYAAFSRWDLGLSKRENLDILREENTVEAKSENWLRDVRKVISRTVSIPMDGIAHSCILPKRSVSVAYGHHCFFGT